MTPLPVKPPAGSATLTPWGTSLKFGQVAIVETGNASDKWIAGLKVTALEKAPRSDYKKMRMRDDAGIVYYLRYDVTRLTGKMTDPPHANDAGRLQPLAAEGQKAERTIVFSYPKCSPSPATEDKRTLEIGEKATNLCVVYVADKGTLTQVIHRVYNFDTGEAQIITWK